MEPIPALPRAARRPAATRSAGFTLVEMVITLMILVVVLLGVMALFDMASKISRVQSDVADVQQTLRAAQYDMVRMIRMAGRGSLPIQGPVPPGGPPWPAPDWTLPNGIGVQVQNNVADNTFIDPGDDTRRVLRGTDVVTVRGVITTAVCTVVDDSFTYNSTPGPTFGRGSMRVQNVARNGIPVPQSLAALDHAVTNRIPEALVIVSPIDDSYYHIVELDPGASSVDARDGSGNATLMTIAFRASPGDGTRTAAYWELSGSNWDTPLVDAAVMGIVEEYRYWVEDVRDVLGDQTSQVSPTLVRSRVFPGTNDPRGAGNLAQPVAEHVTDLQVALGIETGGASAFEPAEDGTADDEWLYNNAGDDDQLSRWRTGKLFYLRLSTTTVAPRLDRDYLGPANETLEDHTYVVPDPGTASPATPDRRHRRRTLRTVIDMRNLG
jgi:prepilin-type N-terminal cleavage/methylation domain-containing protein